MRKVLLVLSLFLIALPSSAQHITSPPTYDGAIGSNEYGDHSNMANRGNNFYMTWDASNLYIAVTGSNIWEGTVIYLDINPSIPVDGGSNSNGNLSGQTYDGTNFDRLPFRADVVLFVKNNYREYRLADGSGAWGSSTAGFGNYAEHGMNGIREFSFPWAAIGGIPPSFNWFGYVTSGSGFIYNPVPTENPGGQIGTSIRYERYYTVSSTADGSSTKPFSRNSFVYNRTSDVASIDAISIFDFTMNLGSRTLTKGNSVHWEISGSLIIGDGTINFPDQAINGGSCNINGSLNIRGGTLDLKGRSLTLKSSASSTARVDVIAGSLLGATNVTVERYIPAKRAWRLLTAPLTGSSNNSIFYNWQNDDNPVAGTGVELWTTASNGGTADPGSSNSGLALAGGNSILRYVSGTGWQAVTNTNSTELFTSGATDTRAYSVFVTGPYNNGNGNIASGASETVLKATGTLRTGNVTINAGLLSANQYYLVGNPYASPVNPASLSGNNLSNGFWMWDPNLSGANGVGGYVTYNRQTNEYNTISASYSNTPLSHIQSGQAFFIQAAGAGTTDILFEEADKSSNTGNNQFRNANTSFEQLRIILQKDFTHNGTYVNADATVAVFHSTIGAKGIDNYDIRKFNNSSDNLSLLRESVNLTFEHRPVITDKDTLHLRIWNTSVANYRFSISAENIVAMAGLSAVIKDHYLNTEIPLNLNGNTVISFSVDANAASTGERFSIYFKNNAPLPVQFISVNASLKNDKIVVAWTVASEKNISYYGVEKSDGGTAFRQVGRVSSQGNSGSASYSLTDLFPVSKTNYYRIKSVDVDGTVKFSPVVRVNFADKEKPFTIYPNPIVGGSFELTLNKKGKYRIYLYNASGQLVFTERVDHAGGSLVQKINIPANVSAGIYQLEIRSESDRYAEKLIIY